MLKRLFDSLCLRAPCPYLRRMQTPPSSPISSLSKAEGSGLGGGFSLSSEKDVLPTSGPNIYKFVITGGPCAGKTTAMERLQVFLRERGFRVFIVSEAATMLFLNGASPDDLAKRECAFAFQQFVINTQISLEDSFENYAKSCGQKSVLLCDRGIMDGSAYVDDDAWAKILKVGNILHNLFVCICNY